LVDGTAANTIFMEGKPQSIYAKWALDAPL
jgi:hypothetical protein